MPRDTSDRKTGFNPVAELEYCTVVAQYDDLPASKASSNYQSEADMENELIAQLEAQGYERLNITCEADLIKNLRLQLEKLNDITFTDSEWDTFFKKELAGKNGIVDKTKTVQEDNIKQPVLEDGSKPNIRIIDKVNIHKNSLQVINQYEADSGHRKNRYDVTILVNGLPLIHVELKRRGVAIREAFNQIRRYQKDSFWSGSGLFEYVQIYVISNGTNTKYYSNTTRDQHVKRSGKNTKSSNTFEFTHFWADQNNKPLRDIRKFTSTFLSKHTLLAVLTRYCVFDINQNLLVMRPYQIVATEKILNRILTSTNSKRLGTLDAGGYIWHTTGSGKTLTSFKTAKLASEMQGVEKVLFVVDRKDLDYQTMREYDRFEEGAADSTSSTKELEKHLFDSDRKIIVTTIQKLDRFIKKAVNARKSTENTEGLVKRNAVFDARTVLIFDECHRSQFGDTHKRITKYFKNYNIFGFTGTPIFATNASMTSEHFDLTTTEQSFGDKLHAYTIVDAINDGNVLGFRVDYVRTVTSKGQVDDVEVEAIDTEAAPMSKERVAKVTEYILDNFDAKTKRNQTYGLSERRLSGFNSLFAVQSINLAKKYYDEFRHQQTGLEEDKRLKVGIIYSFAANEDDALSEVTGLLEDEQFDEADFSKLDQSSADFLQNAISDYNQMFGTSFSLTRFQDYYKDISERTKKNQLDIVIVVGMLLTGFDAPMLNTLWVDKNLKYHGLLQAFSRTNRILNSIKTYGNIVCFRDLEKRTEEALSLFGNKDAAGVVLLKTFKEYYYGYNDVDGKPIKGYEQIIAELLQKYPQKEEIVGEAKQKDFVKHFGNILKLRNILSSFDDFKGKAILSERDFQDYSSLYLDLCDKWRPRSEDKANVNDDLVFEIELVKQIEVNLDYILALVEKYSAGSCQDKEILQTINKAINASLDLRSKKELIEQFITRINPEMGALEGFDIRDKWYKFVDAQQEAELSEIIAAERLDSEKTRRFMKNSFNDGYVSDLGTAFSDILPPLSRFSKERETVRQRVFARLADFLEKYLGA